MVQIQSAPFFPYEILIVTIGILIFALIYTYLSTSLNPKKDKYIASIENKITKQNIYESEILDSVYKSYIQKLSQSRTLKPYDLDSIRKDFYTYIRKERENNSEFYSTLTFAEHEAVNTFLQRRLLKEKLQDIMQNKEKVRLSDLQKIDQNPDFLNVIHRQRLGQLYGFYGY